jgi:undecaprenol kinase
MFHFFVAEMPFFNFQKLRRSFRFAFKGISTALRTQQNMRIHFVAAVVVICAGFYFKLNQNEWMSIVFAIGLVILSEFINTAMEQLVDHVSLDRSERAGKIKDVGAAAVLIASIISVIIAAIVFIPHIF